MRAPSYHWYIAMIGDEMRYSRTTTWYYGLMVRTIRKEKLQARGRLEQVLHVSRFKDTLIVNCTRLGRKVAYI